MLYLDDRTVRDLLSVDDTVAAMSEALRSFSDPSGGVVQPLRTRLDVSDRGGSLYVMPAYASRSGALATKLVTLYPGNALVEAPPGTNSHEGSSTLPTHHSIIVLFNSVHGQIEALLSADYITSLRTAAVSTVATEQLARPDSRVLALVGAGTQAYSHWVCLSRRFQFERVNIWSRTKESAERLARTIGSVADVCSNVEETVHDADVICTVSMAKEPIVCGRWLKAGAHVNAVGAPAPSLRELDDQLMQEAVVYTDSTEAANRESGDVILSRCQVYAEIGEVLLGKKQAFVQRTTVFKSLGMAVEDAIVARLVYDRFRQNQPSS